MIVWTPWEDQSGSLLLMPILDTGKSMWTLLIRKIPHFTTHLGIYQFLRMPFGLKNVRGLSKGHWIRSCRELCCLVYLDDIIIFSRSAEQHLKDLDLVLGMLARSNVSLKFKKCKFFTTKVKYLGRL
jgi:Reverse transcriptase (RNA-dependent DNA polymerase)